MKRTISILLACVLLVGTMLTLASCGGPSGTYEGIAFDLKFKGSNVTIVTKGVFTESKEITGTYKISEKDDAKTITFDFVDEDKATDEEKEILNAIDAFLSADLPYSEEDGTITIGSGFTKMTFKKK